MPVEHTYVVTYDIACPKRLRLVCKTVEAYGERLQLSVFQCRLTRQRRQELCARFDELINHAKDSVMIFDLGRAESVRSRVEAIGRPFEPIRRRAMVF